VSTSPLQELLSALPTVETRSFATLSCGYGADYVSAGYCGFNRPPQPPPGIWEHGWTPRHLQFDPAAVIAGWGSYESVKETERFWVARRDEEEYLRSCGYRWVKAIGLPVVYLPPRIVERIPGSLLVMPIHSLEYTKHNWNFEQYANEIARIRDRFAEVVACVHPVCWERGYWVGAFRECGIPVIRGARGDDRNALLRLQTLFSTFEFVTTNGYGSHLAYASLLGAKVSIYGPFAHYQRRDYTNTQLYQECPHILEPMLDLTSENTLRQHYPFFFCEPDQASVQREWAAHEVGQECRVSPEELRRLFEWTLPARAKNRVIGGFRRIKREGRETLRHTVRYITSAAYRQEVNEFRDVKKLPPGTPGAAPGYGKPLRFLDPNSFLLLYDEIIRRGVYRFSTADPHPRIIDGGANIGMSIVYFKHLHPGAKIIAFEPDPAIFAALSANCTTFGLSDVELHQEALWTRSGTSTFLREPSSLGGRLDPGAAKGDVEVSTRRLRDLLDEKTALLKLDIEGAETEVLEDCGDGLANVDHMFVEYHSFADRPQTLHRLLAVVHAAGFRVHMHVFQPSPQPLFLRTIRGSVDLVDMNLDIFCDRA
jgi:FkbM family methyltransferase